MKAELAKKKFVFYLALVLRYALILALSTIIAYYLMKGFGKIIELAMYIFHPDD